MAISTSQGGRDTAAIHDDTASEISAVTEKAAPVAADMILIEDSAAGNVKKRVQLGNLALTDIGARVYNNADISVPNTSDTALTFNTERWDTDSIHSTVSNTSRLTCQTAGKYLIAGSIQWAANVNGIRGLNIQVGGATNIACVMTNATATVTSRQVIATIYDLAVGNYVELVVYQSSGGALDMKYIANRSPEFMMQLLAKA